MSFQLEDIISFVRVNKAKGSKVYSLLKKKYGKDFKVKFQALGQGKFKVWYSENKHIFTQKTVVLKAVKAKVSEAELVEFVKEYFVRDPSFEYRRHILTQIREKYEIHLFSDLGFGEFNEFIKRHCLTLQLGGDARGYSSSPEKRSKVKVPCNKRASSYF